MSVNALHIAQQALVQEVEAIVTKWEMIGEPNDIDGMKIGFLAARLGEYKQALHDQAYGLC